MIVFASDNGPWLVFGDHGGSAGPLREGKNTTFEGRHRGPVIVNWPGRIPEGRVSEAMVSTMDVLPTAARLAGAELPEQRAVDGHDIWPILPGASDESPYDAFYFYKGTELQAVRSGVWKLHLPHDDAAVAEAGLGGDVGVFETRHIDGLCTTSRQTPAKRKTWQPYILTSSAW